MSTLLDIIEHIGDTSLWALDETGKQLESNNFYNWGPKGQYKNIEHNGVKKGLNIIGATEIISHFQFLYDEYEKGTEDSIKLSSPQVISFLDKLVEYDTNRGVNLTFVILDNARIHRSHEVRKYIKKYEKRLFLIYQPTYSPQLNPQENMWNWMKRFLASSKAFANIQALSEKVTEFQKLVKDNLDLVKQRVPARNYYK
jgi:transposase